MEAAAELSALPALAGVRFGISSGELVVGDVSPHSDRLEYTALGRPADEAEALARQAPAGRVHVAVETRDATALTHVFLELPRAPGETARYELSAERVAGAGRAGRPAAPATETG